MSTDKGPLARLLLPLVRMRIRLILSGTAGRLMLFLNTSGPVTTLHPNTTPGSPSKYKVCHDCMKADTQSVEFRLPG